MNGRMIQGMDGWMNEWIIQGYSSLEIRLYYYQITVYLKTDYDCIDVEADQREEEAAVFKASQTAQSRGTGVKEPQRFGTRQPFATRGCHRQTNNCNDPNSSMLSHKQLLHEKL